MKYDYDPDEDFTPIPPPYIISVDIGKEKVAEIDYLEIGVKGDTIKAYPDSKGRIIADLNNLKNGYKGLSHVFMRVIYK